MNFRVAGLFLAAALGLSTPNWAFGAALPGEENIPGGPPKERWQVVYSVNSSPPAPGRISWNTRLAFLVDGPEHRSYDMRFGGPGYDDLAARVETRMNENRFSPDDLDRLMDDLRSFDGLPRPLDQLLRWSKVYNKLIGHPFKGEYRVELSSYESTKATTPDYEGDGKLINYFFSIRSGSKDVERIYLAAPISVDFPVVELEILATKLQAAIDEGRIDGSDFAYYADKAFKNIVGYKVSKTKMEARRLAYREVFLNSPVIRAVLDGELPFDFDLKNCSSKVLN